MVDAEKYPPDEEHLGKVCKWWLPERACTFPNVKVEGRVGCAGEIDQICLFLKDGRPLGSLNARERFELRTGIPRKDSPRKDTNLP